MGIIYSKDKRTYYAPKTTGGYQLYSMDRNTGAAWKVDMGPYSYAHDKKHAKELFSLMKKRLKEKG